MVDSASESKRAKEDADVIGNPTDVGKNLGDFLAGLAPFLEFAKRAEGFQRGILQLGKLLAFGERVGKRLAIQFLQLGFVIKTLQVRRPARHVQMDDAFGAGLEMARVDDAVPGRIRSRLRAQNPGIKQTRQRQAP